MEQLIKAVYRKDFVQLAKLIESKVDINEIDGDGRTLLMHAVLDSEPDIRVIELLIQNGCNVNAQDQTQKWSALHFAARDNKAAIVSTLLRNGANVDALDVFGNTPLWRAVMSFNGDTSVASELLKSGANPSLSNESGISPYALAETMGKNELLILF